MAFTKINAAGIGTTETVTVDGLTVINDGSFGGNLSVGGTLTYEDVTNVDSVGLITARSGISITGGDLTIPDAIIHSADTNTRIRFPTSDAFTVETAGVEAIRVDSSQNFGVGTNSPTARFDVRRGDTDGKIAEFHQSTGYGIDIGSSQADAYISSGYNQNFIFKTDPTSGQTERLRIDSSGRLLIGTTSTVNSFTDTVQIFQNTATAAITVKRASDNAYAPYFNFIKSRGSTNSAATVLQSGDVMGYIRFSGTDGTDTAEAATIQAHVDGTPGDNDMPGRLVFYTTADGSQNATERLRITSSGQVFIGESVTSSYDMVLLRNTNGNVVSQIVNTNTGSSVQSILQLQVGSDRYVNFNCNYTGQYMQLQGVNITTSYNDFDTHIIRANNGTEKVRITSGGQLNIGDPTNTSYALKAKTTGSATGLARFENTGGGADGIEVNMYHNSSTPADGDQTGYLQFSGNDDGGNSTIFNAIIGYSTDVSNGSEDGDLRFFCRDAGTFSQKLSIASDGTFTGSSSNDISDQRLKDNIATVVDPITKIKALKGRTFTWKPEAKLPTGTKYGFIAQEVETVVSDLVDDKHGIRQFDKDGNLIPEDENGKINTDEGTTNSKSVNAIGVVPILVEALKEALVKIETLETKVAALEG